VNASHHLQHSPRAPSAARFGLRIPNWVRAGLTALLGATLVACAGPGTREAPPPASDAAIEPPAEASAATGSEPAEGTSEAADILIASTSNRMAVDLSAARLLPTRSSPLRAAGSDRQKRGHRSVRTAAFASFAATPAFAFSPRKLQPGEMAAHMIDVGQGDATLIELNCGAALIDTGLEWAGGSNSKRQLAQYLTWFFEQRRPDLNRTLDLVVISHGHADHANGIPLLLGEDPSFPAVTIRNVVDSGYDTDGADFAAKKQMALRDAVRAAGGNAESIKVDDILWYSGATSAVIDPFPGCTGEPDPKVAVLWGDWSNYASAPKNPNHHSVVTRLDFGEASFLFTGDIQTDAGGDGGLEVMLEDYKDDLSAFDVDVLKVSHHGAANGTTKGLVDATTPCLAMVGVGDPTRTHSGTAGDHGHPRRATLKLLQVPGGGVTGTRPTRRIQAFEAEHPPTKRTDIKRAIFGTAWDGHFVVYTRKNGQFQIQMQRNETSIVAPDLAG
jgi:competence protein ComEC